MIFGRSSESSFQDNYEVYREFNSTHSNFSIKNFYKEGAFDCLDVLKLCTFAGREFECCRLHSLIEASVFHSKKFFSFSLSLFSIFSFSISLLPFLSFSS